MSKLTQKMRQEIIAEYASRHDGQWDPHGFLEEVRNSNGSHPAYAWFTWDRDKAARNWQINEARQFAQGLRIKFEVETVSRSVASIRTKEAPFVVSPMAGRLNGGGYFVTDPSNPEHMGELCDQAAMSLRQFVRRYGAALEHAGISVDVFAEYAHTLEKKGRVEAA